MADEDVQIKFGASLEGLNEGVDEAKEQILSLKEAADTVTESFKGLAELAGIGIGADAFKEWISSSAELGEQMEKAGVKLGITASQASQLSGMATLTGSSFDQMSSQLERLQAGLATIDNRSSRTGEALKVLGVNAREFAGQSITSQIDTLAEAFSRFADGPTKTAAAIALLGRAGAEMLPFLDRGKEGMEELRQTTENTGAVMSNEMAASFAKTNEDLHAASLAWSGLSNRLYSEVNPAVDATANAFRLLMESANTKGIEASVNELATTISRASISMVGELNRVVAIFDRLNAVGQPIADLLNKINAGATWAGQATHDVLTGQNMGVPESHDAAGGAALTRTQAVLDLLNTNLAGAGDSAKQATAGLQHLAHMEYQFGGPTRTGLPPPPVPPMQLGGGRGGDQAAGVAAAQAAKDVEDAKAAAKSTEDDLNEELKAHDLTMTQWVAQTMAALDKEADAVQDAYEKELETANLTSKQKLEIATQESKALDEIAHQEQLAQDKAAEQTAQQWKTAADTIASDFNSQLRGLLAGTTSWAQAMKNIAADLVLQMIEGADKMAIEWIAAEVRKTAAHISANTTMTGSDSAAAAASTATNASKNAEQATADAKITFSNVFAYLSPVMGPFAAAPALAAAAVVAVGGSFAEGTDYVPNDMLAQLHGGEVVLPNNGGVAPAFRDFMANGGFSGQGGDNSINIHGGVHAHAAPGQQMDSKTLARETAKQIARAQGRRLSGAQRMALR